MLILNILYWCNFSRADCEQVTVGILPRYGRSCSEPSSCENFCLYFQACGAVPESSIGHSSETLDKLPRLFLKWFEINNQLFNAAFPKVGVISVLISDPLCLIRCVIFPITNLKKILVLPGGQLSVYSPSYSHISKALSHHLSAFESIEVNLRWHPALSGCVTDEMTQPAGQVYVQFTGNVLNVSREMIP